MKIYNCESHSVAIDNQENHLVKLDNDFYKLSKRDYQELFGENVLEREEEIKDFPILSFLMSLVIIMTLGLYFSTERFVVMDRNFLLANLILFINIFIHESGHILFLKAFFPKSKIKIGFKMYFIYPAFYVDTSYSYFLPKYKRIAVYMAGNFMNCLYIIFCSMFFKGLNKYNYLIISTILINFIPIIKSDGYYAFKTILNQYNLKKTKLKNYIEDTIRGIIMFIFLYLLSKIGCYL